MSYGKDPDRASRGAGAIAARDKAHPHAARARARMKRKATAAYDRAMSNLTMGAKGGLALGAMSRLDQLILEKKTAPSGTGSGGAVLPPTSTRAPTPFSFDKNMAMLQAAIDRRSSTGPVKQKLAIRPKIAGWTYGGGDGLTTKPSSDTTSAPTPPTPPPVPTSTTPPAPSAAKTVGTSSSSGAGGGGGVITTGGAGPSLPALPDASPLPDVAPDAQTGSLSNKAKYAIVGGIALGAYLLMRNKGRR